MGLISRVLSPCRVLGGMMEWGAAAFPEPTLVLLVTFLLFLFLQSPHQTLVPSQLVLNFKLHWCLDESYKYISSPEHLYWEL